VNGNNEPGRRTEEKQNLSNRIQWQSEVGNGANLQYLEKGIVTENNEITVVKDLTYDLYAAVAAAKRGFSCVLDYTEKEKGIVTEINEIEEMKLAANEEIDKTEDEINEIKKQKHEPEKQKHEFEKQKHELEKQKHEIEQQKHGFEKQKHRFEKRKHEFE
jgi:chromosome segregation ATPase